MRVLARWLCVDYLLLLKLHFMLYFHFSHAADSHLGTPKLLDSICYVLLVCAAGRKKTPGELPL